MAATSATVLASTLPAIAADKMPWARFAVTYKGKKYGFKLTPYKDDMLVTMRELGGKTRVANVLPRGRGKPEGSPAKVLMKGKEYTFFLTPQGIKTDIPDMEPGPVETNPGSGPSAQGWFSDALRWLGGLISSGGDYIDDLDAHAAAHLVNHVGGTAEVPGATGKYLVSGGKVVWQGDGGFKAPPPGVEEQSGVWY